ncbi:hypothetical protein ACQUJS_22245 [Ralstonia pseudosolanacearum]
MSALVARIERSSLGEYSWPFVDELKKIADVICTEKTIFGDHTPPKIHVLSDGGLDKYQIYPEQKRPGVHTRRILTIVFPRSLKHFVLLHSILGHELGHAVWRGSEYEGTFQVIVNNFASNAPKLKSASDTADWLYSVNAPAEVKGELAALQAKGVDKANFFLRFANWSAWKEEIACDLIGLMTFGPSFVGALCQLLYSFDPMGKMMGPSHPIIACRVNLMIAAAQRLGWSQVNGKSGTPIPEVETFWQRLIDRRKSDPWFDIAPDSAIDSCIQELQTFLAQQTPSLYNSPTGIELEELIRQLRQRTPPVGFEINADGSPETRAVDFRHILYAGWICADCIDGISFADVNRLCEHAIMQQRAINMYSTT